MLLFCECAPTCPANCISLQHHHLQESRIWATTSNSCKPLTTNCLTCMLWFSPCKPLSPERGKAPSSKLPMFLLVLAAALRLPPTSGKHPSKGAKICKPPWYGRKSQAARRAHLSPQGMLCPPHHLHSHHSAPKTLPFRFLRNRRCCAGRGTSAGLPMHLASRRWPRDAGAGPPASPACRLPPHTLPVKLFESLPAVFAGRNNRLAMI